MNVREVARKFANAAGHSEVPWALAIKMVKRLITAMPWLETEDLVRIARMARLESGKAVVHLATITPANARRLFERAEETKDGKYLDSRESPKVAQMYDTIMRTGRRPTS
jgi:3-hydroxyisobutyrate dehydrogenase-like beta-hydroxyacid dehydrogenase